MANQKKALMVSTVPSTIGQFNMGNVKLLQDLGYCVYVAANFDDYSAWSVEKTEKFVKELEEKNIEFKNICFPRNPLALKKLFSALMALRKHIEAEGFEVVHCHTPVAAMCTRLACRKARKKGTRVIYTAHGFHFFKGAPLKNWLIYYPIEKICSYFTDVLITINQEDYALAKKRMKAKIIEYVPGVGIDADKFSSVHIDRAGKRRELGIPEKAVLLLSVGELNKNKNHEIIIRAIEDLEVYYVIAGKGDYDTYLQGIIDSLGLTERVKLLGYRSDVSELCQAADIFAFPSFREGLSVSVMEAMASGLPVVCSRIRGNTDLIDENGGVLFDPGSLPECKAATETLLRANLTEMGQYNEKKVDCFKTEKVNKKMKELYLS